MQKCALCFPDVILIGTDNEDTCRYVQLNNVEQILDLFVESKKDLSNLTHLKEYEIDQCFAQEVICAGMEGVPIIATWDDDKLTFFDLIQFNELMEYWPRQEFIK